MGASMKSASLATIAALLVSCLALTNVASATNTVDFANSRATLSATCAGLSLSDSMLIAVIGFNGAGLVAGDLGSLSFSTGTLASGSLQTGGTFSAGGIFTIQGNGTNGIPSGALFSGTFSRPVTWTLITLANGTHNYTLTGVVTGMMGGLSVNAVTVQLTVNTGKEFFSGSTLISGGNTNVSSVPEPSTLGYFATGTVTIFGMVRRKLLAR
jgi:hypothetical protein